MFYIKINKNSTYYIANTHHILKFYCLVNLPLLSVGKVKSTIIYCVPIYGHIKILGSIIILKVYKCLLNIFYKNMRTWSVHPYFNINFCLDRRYVCKSNDWYFLDLFDCQVSKNVDTKVKSNCVVKAREFVCFWE